MIDIVLKGWVVDMGEGEGWGKGRQAGKGVTDIRGNGVGHHRGKGEG